MASEILYKRATSSRQTRSSRAGTLFPVGRIHKLLQNYLSRRVLRVSSLAAVYLAAVLEFLVSRVVEAGNAARERRKRNFELGQLLLSSDAGQPLSRDLLNRVIEAGNAERDRRKRNFEFRQLLISSQMMQGRTDCYLM